MGTSHYIHSQGGGVAGRSLSFLFCLFVFQNEEGCCAAEALYSLPLPCRSLRVDHRSIAHSIAVITAHCLQRKKGKPLTCQEGREGKGGPDHLQFGTLGVEEGRWHSLIQPRKAGSRQA